MLAPPLTSVTKRRDDTRMKNFEFDVNRCTKVTSAEV